jgi:DNA-binding XRE family transcriptional regulator
VSSPSFTNQLRERRRRAGLTQAELGARAGVSRQAVAAIEAGRHAPAVDAALRLAAALATTVEQLFAAGPAPAAAVRPALGDQLAPGVPLRLGRVGALLVAAPLADHGTAGAGFSLPDAILRPEGLERFTGPEPDGLVLAGCDPALGLAEAMLQGAGSARLRAMPASTGAALAGLGRGTLHAAAVHGRPGRLPPPPRPVRRIHLARWQVGLGIDPALEARDLEAILERRVDLIQRDRSAASQAALARAARRLGRSPVGGTRATGHLDAARRAAGSGRAAVTTEAAARAFGLRFVSLEEHTVEVWVDEAWWSHPGVAALGELLASADFARRLGGFGGYELAGSGSQLTG